PGHTLPAALDRAGYAPADIDGVVLSHLDWDHCGGLDRFEGPVYVQRREVAYAAAPYPMHAERYDAPTLGRDPPWLHPGLTPVDGETDLAPGVTAFPTPGHTVGHQSVAVETDTGTTVVAVDAVPTSGNLEGEDGVTLGSAMDDFAWWHSVREVRDRADRILPGHEWDLVPEGPGEVG
ncbi:MAG: N-acyl homoserine lactonase family protein, partial [Haloferacaceae archaeon]